MDAYSEMALSSLERLTGTAYAVLVLLAALPLLWYLVQLRALSLIALVLLAGAIALLQNGVDELTVGLVLLSLTGVLIAIDASLLRRRLKRVENLLNAATQSVRALEVAEERRQGFIARHQGSHPAASEDRRGLAPETNEVKEAAHP